MKDHIIEEFKRQVPITFKEINPILIIWSPRKWIREVKQAQDKIDYVDKVWFKHYPKSEVLEMTKQFMKDHPEYTHMIIVVDDVVCPEDSVEKLLRTLLIYDLPVLSGCFNWCNTEIGYKNMNRKYYCTWCEDGLAHPLLNVSFQEIDKEVIAQTKISEVGGNMKIIDAWHFVTEEWRLVHIPIIKQVYFEGFPLAVIRRDIYEHLGFIYNGSTDVPWAQDCDANDIPQFCDFSVKLRHMAGPDERPIFIYNDRYSNKEVIFEIKKRSLI